MSIASVLARGRAAAEALMTDTCVIRRQTGATTDPETGVITPTSTTVYAGMCKVRQASPAARTAQTGDAAVLMQQLQVHVPVSVTGVSVGDDVLVTSTTDPDLTGREFVVRELPHKSMATARRIGVEERTS